MISSPSRVTPIWTNPMSPTPFVLNLKITDFNDKKAKMGPAFLFDEKHKH
jgi:hypothetical protein